MTRLSGAFDDFTPREVWAEYARRKTVLDPSMGAMEYHDAVARVAEELGCGTPREDLTEAQRLAQQRIVDIAEEVTRRGSLAGPVASEPSALSDASRANVARDSSATACGHVSDSRDMSRAERGTP